MDKMGTFLLKLAICLWACCYARNDDADADQKEPSTYSISHKCYNPFWCEAVFPVRECSNRSRCCTDVYNKVECLAEWLQNTSKTYKGSILSAEKVVNLTKNVSLAESQLETFKKEIDELKTLTNDNGKVVTEISTLKTDISSVKTKIDSLNQIALDASGKHKTLETEIEQLKQHNSQTSEALKKLHDEIDSTSYQLSSMDSVAEKQRNEFQTQLSTITDRFDNNITNNENKLQGLLRKETDALSQRLHSSDDRWTEAVDNLNTSIEVLSGTLENVKVKVTQDLKETSIEIRNNIKTIETKTQNIEKGFETFKTIIGDDIEKNAKSVSEQLLATINERSTTLDGKITDLQTSLNSRTSNIDTEIKQLTNSLTKSKQNLESKIKEDIETLRTEVNQNIGDLDSKLIDMLENTKKDIDDTKRQVSEMKNDIEDYKRESAQKLETEKKGLTDLIHRKISEVQTETGNSIENVLNDIEVLKNEIGQRIKDEVEQLSKQTIEVNQTLNEQKQKVDIILPNTFNKEMFIIAFLVLVVLLAINYGIVYVLVKRTFPSQPVARRTRTDSGTSTATFSEEPRSPLKVYDRLAFSKSLPNDLSAPLKDCVGVISFYEDSQKHHKRLLKSVKEHLPERLRHDDIFEYQVVRRHEHIRGIPKAKLCIMFVEFSERHVIIEESGLGLGDLKRKTAESINEMGACLMIVYVKDPGSRSLKSSELFNGSIHCAKTQPELLDLSTNKRFLSIYDKFTDNQTDRLVDVITANIGHSGNKHNLRLNLESLR